jgi:hypothetical protein
MGILQNFEMVGFKQLTNILCKAGAHHQNSMMMGNGLVDFFNSKFVMKFHN